MRSVVVAMTVAIVLPMIFTYGIAVTYTLCAVLIWVSYWYVVRFLLNYIYILSVVNEHLLILLAGYTT